MYKWSTHTCREFNKVPFDQFDSLDRISETRPWLTDLSVVAESLPRLAPVCSSFPRYIGRITKLMSLPLSDIESYSFAEMGVDRFYKAREQDMLPCVKTEELLGMSGAPMGRLLFNSTITLMNHGRICRTMMEQALCYSPTSYPEYMELWLRSLPPQNRSYY